jgi:hypothetical protein
MDERVLRQLGREGEFLPGTLTARDRTAVLCSPSAKRVRSRLMWADLCNHIASAISDDYGKARP